MNGSYPALWSSVIAGERTGISTRKVTHTAPITTAVAYRRQTKHYREHVASCEGFSWPLQQEGGLNTSPSPLHVRGEVQDWESESILDVPSRRRHNRLERLSIPLKSFATSRTVRLQPAFTASPTTGKRACAHQQLIPSRVFGDFCTNVERP